MNGHCCDVVTGKRVGGLAYALQSSEWLEFNMVEKTSSCVQTENNVPSLLLFLYLALSLSLFRLWLLIIPPSVNVAVIFLVFMVLLSHKFFTGPLKLLGVQSKLIRSK